ncbi:unnamed protein product [Penicillium salamii]|uniref:Xylanolytic transcriptional activator regulatory domain-containing protein n=1 Tax=Penicillium salamii TaxID=1612424 RepID=A0A9W4ILI1_9EURO|nr:unnamed protein product [Penicillium salamii]CAG8071846.1 unnamed protein product [Penicillium salamii]CAG8249813.1 unnamed protein product [Penicillium salamii]CAG8250529.1 unnamed protein product [Penicillium salamii]CAG8302262.1 unnamed protein product [Penicillium salamii]
MYQYNSIHPPRSTNHQSGSAGARLAQNVAGRSHAARESCLNAQVVSVANVHVCTRKSPGQGVITKPSLALSIVAVAKLLLSDQDESDLITRAEAIIWEHVERPSMVKLQSLLLIIHYHIQKGHFSRAYMFAGLAARGATALRLNYERPELNPIAQETRRRVLWALTFVDGQFSVGLPEYETIPHTIIYQQLPSSEDMFSGNPQTEAQLSLLGACVRISKIQKDIMRLTRQLALSEQPFAQLNGLVQEIQKDLWRLRAEVEISCGYSIWNPYEMEKSRWFPRYLQISISWHQAHCDLYRLFLTGYPEAAPRVILDAIDIDVRDHAARQCHEHVTQVNRILSGLLNTSQLVLPHYIAICAYQATRLTLFLPSSPHVGLELDMTDAVQKAHTAVAVAQKYFSSPSTRELVLDLQRLVQVADTDPEKIYSELCPSPSLDQGVHRHNHLAIHSLVRQAHFVDEGYENLT